MSIEMNTSTGGLKAQLDLGQLLLEGSEVSIAEPFSLE
jgi:hypothetical protein